jgi:hypothetical protein
MTPSPRRGEGWGEGERRRQPARQTARFGYPHPTLSQMGEGLEGGRIQNGADPLEKRG